MSKAMADSPRSDSKLSPEFRERLLRESRNPWIGLRRILWILCFASSFIGLLIMFSKVFSEQSVVLSNFGIQIGALLIFGVLIYLDRNNNDG